MTSRAEVNDYVKLNTGLTGYVEWIGEVEGQGEMLGLELKEWDESGNDGSDNGKFYFTVRGPGWGFFAKRSQVSKVLERGKGRTDKIAGPASPRVARRIEVVRDSETGLAIGDVVKLRNGKQGEIMFVGTTDFHKNKLIGLKLSNWSERGHDGTVKGKSYFKCHPGYGYFT